MPRTAILETVFSESLTRTAAWKTSSQQGERDRTVHKYDENEILNIGGYLEKRSLSKV